MGQKLLMIDGTRNLLPYLRQNKRHHRPSIDRWSQERKCKQNDINMVGMEDTERSLPFTVDWKVAHSKRNLSLFSSCELWYMFNLCFLSRVFNLAIKSHGESPPSFLQSTIYESIIVILSVTCFVPKYYIVFCMIVMFLTLSSEFQSPLKLRRSFCIYVLLHSWRLARCHSDMFMLCAL